MTRTIVIASENLGKQREMIRLLPDGFVVLTAVNAGIVLPPETGSTFKENALVKAAFAASATGHFAIGDDSGLEVDALGGKPGIYSARYAGVPSNAEKNVEKLLEDLRNVPDERRTARFRCAVVLASRDGETVVSEGRVEGTIGYGPRGTNGFGYDPIFVVEDGRTFAEIAADEKDAMSHRGNALRALLPAIMAIADDNRN